MSERVAAVCRRGLDLPELLRAAVEALGDEFGADGVWLQPIDPVTLAWTTPAGSAGGGVDSVSFLENELLEDDFGKFARLARRRRPVAVLSEETERAPRRSRRYRGILEPIGLAHELRAALVVDSSCWGALCLVRGPEPGDFTPAEAERLALLAPRLAESIRATALRPAPPPTADDPAGTIMVDPTGRVTRLIPEAEAWLGRLDATPGTLPAVARWVATRVRARAAGRPGTEPRARIRGRAGRWIELHGSVLAAPGAAAGGDGTGTPTAVEVAITIGAARPRSLAPLFFEAFGLTRREREVLTLLLRGSSPERIAAELVISRYTARDHIKAIYGKAGVSSRAELNARLLALNIPAPWPTASSRRPASC